MYLLFRYAKPSNPCSILLNFALLSRIVVSGEPNSIVQKSNDKPNIENYFTLAFLSHYILSIWNFVLHYYFMYQFAVRTIVIRYKETVSINLYYVTLHICKENIAWPFLTFCFNVTISILITCKCRCRRYSITFYL